MTEQKAKEISMAAFYGSSKYSKEEVEEANRITLERLEKEPRRKDLIFIEGPDSNTAPKYIHSLDSIFTSN